MDFYGVGLVIALLLWLWSAAILIVSVNSTFERNLNKVGQRLSWTTLQPTPMDADDLKRAWWKCLAKYLAIVGFGLPFIFTSWLYVAIVAGIWIYRLSKDAGAPAGIRELRWKLRNVDMPFDDIVRAMMKAAEKEPSTFDDTRADMLRDLENRGLPHA